jgi:hypothetical protein
MFVAFRAIAYSTLFIAFLLIYLPARVLSWSGITRRPKVFSRFKSMLHRGTFSSAPTKIARNGGFTRALALMI